MEKRGKYAATYDFSSRWVCNGLFFKRAALAMANMYLPAFAIVNVISDFYDRAGKAEKF